MLAERDAVAAKTAAAFSRGEARDYLDLAGILASGHYSREELMVLAARADAGSDRAIFAEALAGVDRFPDQEFARYGVDAEEIARVRATMRDWSGELEEEASLPAASPTGRDPARPAGSGQQVDAPGERSLQGGPSRGGRVGVATMWASRDRPRRPQGSDRKWMLLPARSGPRSERGVSRSCRGR